MNSFRLLALLPFAGIIAYWYFVPYQIWLSLNHITNVWFGVGSIILLLITFLVGLAITFVLGLIGLGIATANM